MQPDVRPSALSVAWVQQIRQKEEAKMDYYTISVLAQQHIDDLRRDASRRRLAQITRKHKRERTVRGAVRLQRAAAP
jgi:hypothetical protein